DVSPCPLSPYDLPFHVTLPVACASFERKSRYENTGSPKRASALELQEKCALRIRFQRNPNASTNTTNSPADTFVLWSRYARNDKAPLPAIKRNSVNRNSASCPGVGKSRTRFLVQPSRNW